MIGERLISVPGRPGERSIGRVVFPFGPTCKLPRPEAFSVARIVRLRGRPSVLDSELLLARLDLNTSRDLDSWVFGLGSSLGIISVFDRFWKNIGGGFLSRSGERCLDDDGRSLVGVDRAESGS